MYLWQAVCRSNQCFPENLDSHFLCLNNWFLFGGQICEAFICSEYRIQPHSFFKTNLYALCVCDALPQALFWGKNDVPGFFMPCVCVMHCRRRFFFGKSDVPGFVPPCVCVMHCRRRFFFGKNDVPGIFMPCGCVMHCRRRFFLGKNYVPRIFITNSL